MGFGGKASLIGCKITAANRLPASFFVSVAYDCWAFRRLGVVLDPATGAIQRWLYRDPAAPVQAMAAGEGFPLTGREVVLTAPLTGDQMRTLKVGDVVLIRGEMYTGRDAVHAYLMKNPPPVDLEGAVLYHCGPVMLKEGDEWQVKAAGPTTSIREEPYEHEVLRRYGVKAVIGKGGMGPKTLAALQGVRRGVPERHRRGGAILRADGARVLGVHLLEFGIPEAMWRLQVKDFAAIVTMDAHGNSLHAKVEEETGGRWRDAGEVGARAAAKRNHRQLSEAGRVAMRGRQGLRPSLIPAYKTGRGGAGMARPSMRRPGLATCAGWEVRGRERSGGGAAEPARMGGARLEPGHCRGGGEKG